MARPLRLEFPGALYHVTARGNARAAIVLDDEDRQHWVATLAASVLRRGWRLHAWYRMTNLYHLLVETPAPNLARGMRDLNGLYTQAWNRRHRRVGHVLQGRYKAILVEKEAHFLELVRYVVRNPVTARLVRTRSLGPGVPPAPPLGGWNARTGSSSTRRWSAFTPRRTRRPASMRPSSAGSAPVSGVISSARSGWGSPDGSR